ncbi:MAG: hypothetical protein WAV43_04770 [Streptococcus parauberis]
MKIKIELEDKQIKIIRNYAEEMINLFNETDMVKEGESIYLETENIRVNKKDFERIKNLLKK